MSLPEAAHALLALPPERFVAERDALARALAERGGGAAAEVRRLRRPTGLAWVLNRLARGRPREVEALLRAGERLRAGHRRALAGGGADALRAAEVELREGARTLREAGREVLREAGKRAEPAALSRLELLLRLLAPAPGSEREAFRQGALRGEPAPAPLDVRGLAVVPASGAARPPAPAGRTRAATARPDGAARARQAAEARRAARETQRRRVQAERDLGRAEREARRAEAAAANAETAARRAADRAREVRARAETARAEVVRRAEALRALARDA
jgi:hypothetical protein